MPSFKLTALAAAAILAVASAEMQLVPAAFNATAYNSLIDCVKETAKETGGKYDVAVDNGRTIIIPAEGSEIDLDAGDKALGVCLDEYALTVKIGIDDDRSRVEGKPTQPLDQATSSWAESQGALGMTSENGTIHARDGEVIQLAARAAPRAYYYAHGSFHEHCASAGSIITYTGSCKSQMGAYKSIAFGNADPTHSLRASMWPHHDCGAAHNDNGRRTISVPAGHTSACQERTTYSWYGVYCC